MDTGNTRSWFKDRYILTTFNKKVAFEFVAVNAEKGGFTYIYGKYHQRDEQCDFRNIREEFVIQILRVSKMIFFKCESDTSLII